MNRRSLASAAAVFAVVASLVVLVEGVVLSTRLTVAVPVAVVVGLGFGALAYYQSNRSSDR